MPANESRRFRFGLFEFDAETGELRREGVPVRLQAQPAQVLACLLERAGQVISRDQLRQAVWGSETFVDFDRGLNFAISQVRAALKDDSAEPSYIRTLPKQGYQFIAPLERISGTPGAHAPAPPERRHARSLRLLVVGLPIVVAAVGAVWLRSRQVPAPPPIVAVARFDNETGNPVLTRLSDALTDDVVVQLASASRGRYSVIGNAQILRQPRERRDLSSIGSSLNAAYVVLGQVQSSGEGVRVLAHLIRVSDQTHLCVAGMERGPGDPLDLESQAARKVAAEFAPSVTGNAICPALLKHVTP
jgi:DNA-binding winged helix-turn-helix (wHTH) protein/TolB-like protein